MVLNRSCPSWAEYVTRRKSDRSNVVIGAKCTYCDAQISFDAQLLDNGPPKWDAERILHTAECELTQKT